MTKKQKIVDYINNTNPDGMVALHNAWCKTVRDMEYYIYSQEKLDDVLKGLTPTDILQRAFRGKFNPKHKYFFWFDGYASLGSADCISDTPIFVNDIADYILAWGDSLKNNEIRKILDEDNI